MGDDGGGGAKKKIGGVELSEIKRHQSEKKKSAMK